VYFSGDITGDGRSEIFIGDDYEDTLLIFSGPDTSAIYFKYFLDGFDEALFHYYDYDNDSTDELCITKYNNYPGNRENAWFKLDTVQNKMIRENHFYVNVMYELTSSYPTCFGDINGDGFIDITHVCYSLDNKFVVIANLGKGTSPYFEDGIEVIAGTSSRFLYGVGDINNDGSDDWYTKTSEDTVLVFYGNENVVDQGFIKEYYSISQNHFMHPPCMWYSYYLIRTLPVFYYNDDSIPDLLFDFWSFDEDLRFDTIGTAIVLGDEELNFDNPFIAGRAANDCYPDLQYGYRTKDLGDINNDGFQDWGTLALTGCYAEVFLGDTYFHEEPDFRILLPQDGKSESHDWASGDLNSDGWPDLAISSSSVTAISLTRNLIRDKERVFIFLGRPQWPELLTYHDADYILLDDSTFYEFGRNIGIVGDYNADGFDDLVVGGGKHKDCLREAFVYFGGDTISPEPDMVISVYCTQCGIRFADPITPCGDINADGYDDFTFGDPNNMKGQSLVYFGGPEADSLYDVALRNPELTGSGFGDKSPREEGDYDADGYPDLVQFNSYPDPWLYVYKGGPQFDTIIDYKLVDTLLYGPSVEYVNSFSMPGKSDLYLSNYNTGESFIFSDVEILNENADYVLKEDGRNALGFASGDFDSDGYSELCTGIPYECDHGTSYGGIIRFYQSPFLVGIGDGDEHDNEWVRIFPNPVEDQVTIDYSNAGTGKIILTITSISGQLLFEDSFYQHDGDVMKKTLDVSQLLPGVYIIRLVSGSAMVCEKLIVY
jgi:hypothetical protein